MDVQVCGNTSHVTVWKGKFESKGNQRLFLSCSFINQARQGTRLALIDSLLFKRIMNFKLEQQSLFLLLNFTGFPKFTKISNGFGKVDAYWSCQWDEIFNISSYFWPLWDKNIFWYSLWSLCKSYMDIIRPFSWCFPCDEVYDKSSADPTFYVTFRFAFLDVT